MQRIIFSVELNNISKRELTFIATNSRHEPTPLVQEVEVDMVFHHRILAAAFQSSCSANSLPPYVSVVVHVFAFCVVQSGDHLPSAFVP
jgi:hypothetical protein